MADSHFIGYSQRVDKQTFDEMSQDATLHFYQIIHIPQAMQ